MRDGGRLNFTFTGTVQNETMEGEVHLGEYGTARWKGRRYEYRKE